MKAISYVSIDNIIGINKLQLHIGSALTLICGPNKAGKTSALDAIAYVATGNKYRNLRPLGQRDVLEGEILNGSSIVLHGYEGVLAAIMDGKPSGAVGDMASATVIPGTYLDLIPKLRVALLLGACGITIDPRKVIEEIKDLDPETRETVVSRAIVDLDTAEVWCRDAAKRQKARWQSVTAEEWGAKKGGKWVPSVPEGDLEALSTQRGRLDADRGMEAATYTKVTEELGAARATAERSKPRRSIAEVDAVITSLQGIIDKLQTVVGTQGTIEPCPHCGESIVVPIGGGNLRKADSSMHIPEASKELRGHLKTMDVLKNERSAAQLALELQGEHRPVEEIAEEQAASVQRGKEIAAKMAALTVTIAAIQAGKEAKETADDAHKRIVALLAAAEELSPTGYRQRQLERAIATVNAALPAIGPYTLDPAGNIIGARERGQPVLDVSWLSESEQWRANAAVAMALAGVAKGSLVLLDRFDVIEPEARLDLLDELEAWSKARGIQIIIAATLKKAPTLPTVKVNWIGSM